MTSYLARLTALESRLASPSLIVSGKRRRVEWLCAACTEKRELRQRRAYGADSIKLPYSPLAYHNVAEGNEEDALGVQEVVLRDRTQHPSRDIPETAERFPLSKNDLGLEHGAAGYSHSTKGATVEAVEANVRSELPRRFPIDHSLLELDYVSGLPRALMTNTPDAIARCLYAAAKSNDVEFIQSIPRSTFAECIRILQPANTVGPTFSTHSQVSEGVAARLRMVPADRFVGRHMKILETVLKIRRAVNVSIGLQEYQMLLKSARDLGARNLAVRLWQYMTADGVKPDIVCFNHMMAATVRNHVHQASSRQRTRITAHHLAARRVPHGRRGKAFASYGIEFGGVKEDVVRVFEELLRSDSNADEESFRNVILAAAREGDLSTVKSVLRKVWHVDLDAASTNKQSATVTFATMDQNSVLYPTTALLRDLAHSFGINNDISSAMRAVDLVARSYKIDIDPKTWSELFERTFVLAARNTTIRDRADGTATIPIPLDSLLNLWNTMTAPPYLVKPTMKMYNLMIKNLQDRESPSQMYDKMTEGMELFHASVGESRRALRAWKLAVRGAAQQSTPRAAPEALRTQWEQLDFARKRNLFWVQRWLRLLLSTLRSHIHVDREGTWALRRIPRILWQWRWHAPRVVRYHTVGGVVELRMRTDEETAREMPRRLEREAEVDGLREQTPMMMQWTSGGLCSKRERLGGESVEDRG